MGKRAPPRRSKASQRRKKKGDISEDIVTAEENVGGGKKINTSKGSNAKKKDAAANRKRTYIREETKEVDLDETGYEKLEKSHETVTSQRSKSEKVGVNWAKDTCKKGLRPLLKEFAGVKKFVPKGITTEQFNKNSSKNRYTDVLCLDSTRVKLKGRPKDNDYIHANWVTLPSKRKYICTQGPLDDTVEDFWLMVFKEKVPAIIMLCDIMENGENKCAEYYPGSPGETIKYGELKVKNVKKEKSIDGIQSHLLSVEMGGSSHKVQHYKWADWPDRVAPTSPTPIVKLLMATKTLAEKGPVVVHCSAGIGRTGTYCAVDYSADELAATGSLATTDVVKELRKQRLHSVQSTLQFLYLHTCILEYLVTNKIISRDSQVKKFQHNYEKYLKKFNERTK